MLKGGLGAAGDQEKFYEEDNLDRIWPYSVDTFLYV
jgi:hypothetical protein